MKAKICKMVLMSSIFFIALACVWLCFGNKAKAAQQEISSDYYTWDSSTQTLTLKTVGQNQLCPSAYKSIVKKVIIDVSSNWYHFLGAYQNEDDTGIFEDCTELETVEFKNVPPRDGPQGFQIGYNAFKNCTKLKTILYNSSNKCAIVKNNAFYGCSSLESIDLNSMGASSIKSSAFEGCTALTEIIFSSDTDSIYEDAFKGCTSLTSIDLSNHTSLYTLQSAFEDCTNLTDINLSGCANLTTATINNESVESINLSGCAKINVTRFTGCESLKNLNLSGCTDIEQLGDSAFSGCESLEVLDLSDCVNLETIDNHYWDYGCNLKTIKFAPDCNVNRLPAPNTLESINIPSTKQSITYTFMNCTHLKEVDFSHATGLTTIGLTAFCGCTSLENIDLSNCTNLTFLGGYAFDKSGLKNITLPEGITDIGNNAFSNCTSLESIDLSNCTNLTSIGAQAFRGSGLKTITLPEGITDIEDCAFWECASLESIDLSNCTNLTSIGEYAFSESGLKSIIIPEGVTSIGAKCFQSCATLESIELPSTLKTLPPYLCEGDGALATVTIKNGEHAIGIYDFYNCNSLSTLNIDWSDITFIGAHAFDSNDITKSHGVGNFDLALSEKCTLVGDGALSYLCPYHAYIPSTISLSADNYDLGLIHGQNQLTGFPNVKLELEYAPNETAGNVAVPDIFKNCKYLKSIILPEGAKETNTYGSFMNCTALETAVIPNTFVTVGVSTFYGCTALKTVNYPEAAKIQNSTFYGCESLEEINFVNQSSVNIIGDYAFSGCKKLKDDVVNGFTNVKEIGNSSFYSCDSLKSITLPESLTSMGNNSAFSYCDNLTDMTILGSITEIPQNCFYQCTSLKNIVLPDTVEIFQICSFYNCGSLVNINMPESLKTIRNNVFRYCVSLEGITFKDHLKTIERSAFEDCKKLASIDFGNSVEEIGEMAFQHCGLKKVKLPDSVKTVASQAFKEQGIPDERYRYTSLKEVELSAGMTEIASNTFYNNCMLEKVILKEGLQKIGSCNFYSWFSKNEDTSDLPELKIYTGDEINKLPSSLTTICSSAFCLAKGISPQIFDIVDDTVEDGYCMVWSGYGGIITPTRYVGKLLANQYGTGNEEKYGQKLYNDDNRNYCLCSDSSFNELHKTKIKNQRAVSFFKADDYREAHSYTRDKPNTLNTYFVDVDGTIGDGINTKNSNIFTTAFPTANVSYYTYEWNTKPDGTGETITKDTIAEDLGTHRYGEPLYVYAVYKTIDYDLTKNLSFVKDNNAPTSNSARQFVTGSSVYNVETKREGFSISNLLQNGRGFNFLGWFDEDGNKMDAVPMLPSVENMKNLIFTAKYSRNHAKMVFDYNGGHE